MIHTIIEVLLGLFSVLFGCWCCYLTKMTKFFTDKLTDVHSKVELLEGFLMDDIRILSEIGVEIETLTKKELKSLRRLDRYIMKDLDEQLKKYNS